MYLQLCLDQSLSDPSKHLIYRLFQGDSIIGFSNEELGPIVTPHNNVRSESMIIIMCGGDDDDDPDNDDDDDVDGSR